MKARSGSSFQSVRAVQIMCRDSLTEMTSECSKAMALDVPAQKIPEEERASPSSTLAQDLETEANVMASSDSKLL